MLTKAAPDDQYMSSGSSSATKLGLDLAAILGANEPRFGQGTLEPMSAATGTPPKLSWPHVT